MELSTQLIVPKAKSQSLVLEYSQRILTERKSFEEYYSKMEVIDVAYARYQASKDPQTGAVTGQGIDAATQPVGVVNLPSTTPPIVVSQVDSMVGYLADVFLSGSPLFPIVSNPKNKIWAEQLETLLDDHALLGGYARQLLLFLRDGVKYNISAIEANWEGISQYSITDDLLDINKNKKKLNKKISKYTKLKRLDPYNTVWDRNVAPGDIAADGDYAGYVQILSRTKMKRFLTRLSLEGKAFNVREALASSCENQGSAENFPNYRVHPSISDYISPRRPVDGMNWFSYLTGVETKDNVILKAGNYEVFTFYARVLPSEFQLPGPEAKTPQIWKFVVVNNSVLVQAERIISAYDFLPILFGQPLEDGLDYQTQSIAESNIPFQAAAATLFNIRFNSARRAVADRALYDANLISSADVNAPVPAAKIPVKSNSLDQNRKISDAYYQIPFDSRGTESALQDGITVSNFARDLTGLNNPMRGQFQKGNKSVQEWNDTMAGADARLRLPALTLEFQVFMPLKEILKLNIFQYGDDAIVISQKNGEQYDIKIEELKKQVLAFRVADGYTPKSKLAGTESLINLMTMLSQSQPLQASYGPMLPAMFSHLAQLTGVRGLEEYTPNAQQTQQNMLNSAMMQQGVNPTTGLPMLPQPAGPATAEPTAGTIPMAGPGIST